MGNAIAMTDIEILTIHVVGSTVTDSLKCFLIACNHRSTTSLSHIRTVTVYIGTIHRLTTSDNYPIGTLATHATVIPRYEEIVITTMLHDERSLDGIRTRILTGGIRHAVLILGRIAAGNSTRLFPFCYMHRRI